MRYLTIAIVALSAVGAYASEDAVVDIEKDSRAEVTIAVPENTSDVEPQSDVN